MLQDEDVRAGKKHSQISTGGRELKGSILERALKAAGSATTGTLPAAVPPVENGGAKQGSQLNGGGQDSTDSPREALQPNATAAESATWRSEASNATARQATANRGPTSLLQQVMCAWQTPDGQRLYLLYPHAPHSLADLLRFNPSSLADDVAIRLMLYQVTACH